ncbi:hypothetical protein, partial [Loktanella atrilutea]|uniref:hypothetical protein n=1 Tax=Loktanella atrilutea TaxID=366533 RepID=UPI001C4A4228
TLFEIVISEEICGRFGSVRWIRRLYIALLGFRPDDGVSASLFDVVLCYLWITWSTEDRETSASNTLAGLDVDDVQRFERQG